jgi:hypothetical protein
MTDQNGGVLAVRPDEVVDVPSGLPWPAALASVVEHTVITMFGGWPTEDDELWWPTAAAWQEAP